MNKCRLPRQDVKMTLLYESIAQFGASEDLSALGMAHHQVLPDPGKLRATT
jgi:hypothetical protein